MTDKLDEAELKLELCKPYDDSPEAFEQIVDQLQRMAVARAVLGPDPETIPMEETADYLDLVLPPIEIVRGKARKVSEGSLVSLLVDYQFAQSRGVRREAFREHTAGRKLGNGYDFITLTEATVDYYLREAQEKAKFDVKFAFLVAGGLRMLLSLHAEDTWPPRRSLV